MPLTPPLASDVIHKELDLIQDVIKRMAENSFKIKAWLIGVLGVMVTLSKDILLVPTGGHKTEALLICAALLLSAVCFWYLDGFFLSTEKQYRELYKWVLKYRKDTADYLYDLNTFTRTVGDSDITIKKESILDVMWTDTLRPFYMVPLALIAALIIYNGLQ